MKKKFWIALVAILTALCLSLTLVACGDEDADPNGGKPSGDPNGGSSGAHVHDWGEWFAEIPADCEYNGLERRYCQTCDLEEERQIPATGHTLGAWQYDDAEHWRICEVCDEWVVYEEHASKTVCDDCGYTETVSAGLQYVLKEDDTYAVVGMGTFNGKRLIIPAEHNGRPVTSIGAENMPTNFSMHDLVKVVVPESVTEIYEYAFYGISPLKYVTLPSNLTMIGTNVFASTSFIWNTENWENGALYYNNYLLAANEDIPSVYTVKAGTKLIAGSAFSGIENLTSVTVPAGCKLSISTFEHCFHLTTVVLPNDLTEIPMYAFRNDGALANFEIPDGVTVIGQEAFADCASLPSIVLPEGLKEIGLAAFRDCHSLSEVYFNATDCNDLSDNASPFQRAGKDAGYLTLYVGANVTKIPASLFNVANSSDPNYDSYLNAIEFAANGNLQTIGYNAFYYNTRLTFVEIPEGVTTVGIQAFASCHNLYGVVLPSTIALLDDGAFAACYSLVEVWDNTSLGLEVPNAYPSTENGYIVDHALHVYHNNEPSKVVQTDGYAFYQNGTTVYLLGYIGVESALTLPALSPNGNRYDIFDYAFYLNSAITSVTIPANSVRAIGRSAFMACYNLTSVTMGLGVETIGEAAFLSSNRLATITLPASGVTAIGQQAFESTAYLDNAANWTGDALYMETYLVKVKTTIEGSLLVKAGTTLIAHDAISWCDSLTALEIPGSVKILDINAVSYNANLAFITLHEGITILREGAFYRNDRLQTVNVPGSVKEIGSSAFAYCNALISVVLNEGTEIIGNEAFYGCEVMSTIVIPTSVTTIGTGAFYNNMEKFYYLGTESEWNAMEVGYSYSLYESRIYYYSATQPAADGKHYWHYVSGTIVDWQ